jgi:hypothetical protein
MTSIAMQAQKIIHEIETPRAHYANGGFNLHQLTTQMREAAKVALAKPLSVHVAVIEWADDSREPYLFASTKIDELEQEIRDAIEGAVGVEHRGEGYWEHWVAAHKGDGRDYHEWYDELHDLDESPWVTIETKEVSR